MASSPSENDTELTSTVDVLSTSTKEEKGDTSDAIPTSSTDASTAATTPHLVSDDPISSTSSELDQNKSAMTTIISEIAPEEDLLGISITNIAGEKITEDVEDLVHDLESLLEGPFPAAQKDTKDDQQTKKLTGEFKKQNETLEHSEIQHNDGQVEHLQEVERFESESKADVEEGAVTTVEVGEKIASVEEQRKEELDTDVGDCVKQDLKVASPQKIEDVAVKELIKEDSREISEGDGSKQQIEVAPLSENVHSKDMDHISNTLGDTNRENNAEVKLDKTGEDKSTEGCLDTAKEIVTDQAQADMHLTLEAKTPPCVIDDEQNDISSQAEVDQASDNVTQEKLVEDTDTPVNTANEGKVVEASIVDTEGHEQVATDDSSGSSQDNVGDDVVEVLAANENTEHERVELSAEDQKTAGEQSREDNEKCNNFDIETCAKDGAETVNLTEDNSDNISGITAGKGSSSANNENPTETEIFDTPTKDTTDSPVKIGTLNDSLSEDKEIDAEVNKAGCEVQDDTTIEADLTNASQTEKGESVEENAEQIAQDSIVGDDKVQGTVTEGVSQEKDLNTSPSEMNQTEVDLNKEDIVEENVEEVTQDLVVTSALEGQSDKMVEATITEAVSETEVSQTEGNLDKEDIAEENVEEVKQDAVATGDDEVKDDVTVEATIAEDIPQVVFDSNLTHENQSEGEVEKEEMVQESVEEVAEDSVVTGDNEVKDDTTVEAEDMSQADIDINLTNVNQMEGEVEKGDIAEENVEEVAPDSIETGDHEEHGDTTEEATITEVPPNAVETEKAEAIVNTDEPEEIENVQTPEAARCEESTDKMTSEEGLPESLREIDEIAQFPVDEMAEHKEDGGQENITEEIDKKSQSDVFTEPVLPVEVTEDSQVPQEDNITSTQGEVDVAQVEEVGDEETKAAVNALGAFIDEGIDDPPNAPEEGVISNDDNVECEIEENKLQCGTGLESVPEDETEAAVKFLADSVGEHVESPSSVSGHEVDIIPEYEETEAAVAALTSNETPYCHSPGIPDESVVCTDQVGDMKIVEETVATSLEENENLNESLIVGKETDDVGAEGVVNSNEEIESAVTTDKAESKAVTIQDDEAVNEEETRAAVEAVIRVAGEEHNSSTPDTTSEQIQVLENEEEKELAEELPGSDTVESSVENREVETTNVLILEASDYKSPKSVGGATAVSVESEEEMEALALEPDESPPATKSSPLASIEEVEESAEQESHEDAKVKQSTKKEFERQAVKEVVGNDSKTEVIVIEDVEQTNENNVAEVKERSGRRFEKTKQDTTDVETCDDIEKGIENLPQTVEAESSEISTVKEKESKKMNERPRRGKRVQPDSKLEELSINVDLPEKEKPYSPKVIIKPIKVPDDEISTTSNSDNDMGKGCLKMTITKQSDNTHSILKICDSEPVGVETAHEEGHIPKLRIKSILPPAEQHSPKSKNKQTYSPTGSTQRSSSPRVTIKPVQKPEVSPLKIKIGLKGDDTAKRASPKLNIKAVTDEDPKESVASPKKAKPTIKAIEEAEQLHSPRITIKPIPKHDAESPKLRLKVHEDEDTQERSSPKITIKPLVKPQDPEEPRDDDESAKERIVLKINKGNLPVKDDKSEKLAKITLKLSKEGGAHIVQQPEDNPKRPNDEPALEKNKKQKSDPKQHPVAEPAMETRSRHKEHDAAGEASKPTKHKDPTGTESPIDAKRSKLSPSPARDTRSRSKDVIEPEEEVRVIEARLDSPIVISEDSRSQDSGSCIIIEDTASEHSFTPDSERKLESEMVDCSDVTTPTGTPTPKRRGRPRKRRAGAGDTPEVDPLLQPEESTPAVSPPAKQIATPKQVATTKQIATSKQIAASKQAAQAKQAAAAKAATPKHVTPPTTEQPSVEVAAPVQALHESGRPKRSCRGQSAIDVLGIKPRKPRQPNAANPRGGGRGGKRTTTELRI
nr:unnamed protein product [Callosobruchus analis]